MNEVVIHGILKSAIAAQKGACEAGGGKFKAEEAPNGTFSASCVYPAIPAIVAPVSNSDIVETMATQPPVASMDTPTPAPLGGPSDFVSAHKTATKTVLLVDNEGREFLRVGGSRSWRNFNPGNIRKGGFSNNHGAIGDDGSFAIGASLFTRWSNHRVHRVG